MAKFFKKKQQTLTAKSGAVSGSEAIDDYLKSIFRLSGREERQVSSTEIAGDLNITAASVTNMLQKLASLEPPLVVYEKHRGVQLSKAGKKRALEVEIEAINAGYLPKDALDSLDASRYLRDNEEYWPFEGDDWPDEFVGTEGLK